MIPRQDRYTMVSGAEVLSFRRQCELLCIPRTKLYYKPKPESQVNLHIMRLMDEQYIKTPFYGFPRMFDYVQNACSMWVLNPKRVYRLYKTMGLKSLLPGPNTSNPDTKTTYKFPYLLNDIVVNRVNQVWASDITYIPMSRGYMYLYAIIDLHSRFIVNWGISNSMTSDWVSVLTREAILNWGRPEIFNTDQGSQFTSEKFISTLKEFEIKISMDGKGRAIDNIFIERFWRTIKYELIYLNPFNSGYQLYQELEEYIRYYNFERGHSSIGKLTPAKLFNVKDSINFLTKYSTINSTLLV